MTSPPSFSFSKPAMPGDAVSVLVLVENSAAMAAKWPDVRDSYLPNLLENLRAADPSVQMEARWLTTSSTSSASALQLPGPIPDTPQARVVHDLPLGQAGSAKLHPTVISDAISILSSASRRQSTTRHLVLVAATGPLRQGAPNEATTSEFDKWEEIAMLLKQQYIRLHVILNIGAEMRTYHELFKRSLQHQNNSEVPAWFQVDSRRFSIRLSGRPQYVRSSASVPISLAPAPISESPHHNPSPPASSPTASPPPTSSTPGSPNNAASPSSRRSSTSPTTARSRPRAPDSPQSPPATEAGGGGLVHYLQQMHGLTKKKSYGVKAPKKTYADIRLPNAGRPILPRLEVPSSQSDIYTYPTFDNPHAAELQTLPADPQLPPPRRHSADQLPSASLVVRTSNGDRRARGRGPWLPIAPLVSSTPSSPTSATSPSTLAALQSLASMTPRLPEFVTRDRMPAANGYNTTEPPSVYQVSQGTAPLTIQPFNGAYYPDNVGVWAHQTYSISSIPSPTPTVSSSLGDASLQFPAPTSPPTPQLVGGSEYSSPPSSSAATPASVSVPMADSLEDQPFLVSPEYEARINASFNEAVRSGTMQASMTSAIQSVLPATTISSPTFTPSVPAQVRHEQLYYPPAMSATPSQHMVAPQDANYSVDMYQSHSSAHAMHGIMLEPGVLTSGGYYAIPDSYTATPVPEYAHGQWYSA